VLAAGTAAQAAFSAIGIGLPAIAPALRDEFGLSLAEVGVVLSAEWIGLTLTLLAWGLLADRIGERLSLGLGLGGCGLLLCAAAYAPGFWWLVVLVALAGAVGGSVQSASGRAVMAWFEPEERGFALGIRQTAVPLGGLIGALALPAAVGAGGVDAAFWLLGGLCLAGALVGVAFIRDRGQADTVDAHDVPWTLADRRLWLLCFGSGLYLVAQMAIFGFAVLFLVDERGFSNGAAAAVLAGIQVVGAVLRLAVGRWSDALGSRLAPLRWIGLAASAALALAVALLDAPTAVLVPALVVAGGVSMAWNGLSYTAAAELAGRRRSGAAIGFQQTVLSIMGVIVPLAFAATVAATSWRAAFALAALGPLAGWLALRPLREPFVRPRA
jgi:sugar phosphate permease